ncbi:MAG TPA: DUF1569 domain-containing protein [Pirellula sp.]|nr:DUF1569 domain-containing protein [Pirellula sp.]
MERRNLSFSTLADIKSDLLNLLSTGYTKTGEWDLDQMANHLADWMTFPMDGFPKMPLHIIILISIMRITQGKSLYKKFVDNQRMSTGQPTMPQTVHKPSVDPDSTLQSVERLAAVIDRLATYRGPTYPSPLFGKLDYDEVVALQLAHCAHHLSFLVPNP